MKEIIKKQVSDVLKDVLDHKKEYWLDDVYIRWGKVNSELVERINNALTTSHNSDNESAPKLPGLRDDIKTVCDFIDDECYSISVVEAWERIEERLSTIVQQSLSGSEAKSSTSKSPKGDF